MVSVNICSIKVVYENLHQTNLSLNVAILASILLTSA